MVQILKSFYVRRRRAFFRILLVGAFICFVGLWFKADIPLRSHTHPRSLVADGDRISANNNGQELFLNELNGINEPPHKRNGGGGEGEGIPKEGMGVLHQPQHYLNKIPNHPKANLGKTPKLNPQQPPLHNFLPSNEDLIERMRAEKIFSRDNRKIVKGLGEGGKAVKTPPDEEPHAREVAKKEAFNLLLSDKIALNRSVPDTQDVLCKSVSYDGDLPSATVIIIFTNEALSALLRTIYSVLDRSPAGSLKEIILVDDFSDREELREKLGLYVKYRLPPFVKLMNLKERHGLIKARLEGAKIAKGDVLVFLDSHCEANTGWMEPLLQRIKDDRTTVVVPIIEVIDDWTLEYYSGNGRYFQVGGFTWSGHFTWIDVNADEVKRRGSPVAPTRSPTMAGGLFAIERNYFWEIGSYDEGMEVWGGENLEMSFRVWMCGGKLETIPCSKVGHIFRSFHPYTFPGNKDTHGLNTARLAEVWMDDYKKLFYIYRPELKNADWGDVSERKELRSKLHCKSFKWFLDNIMPEKFILDEDSIAYGRLRNKASFPDLCFDNLQRDEKSNYLMGLYGCHDYAASSQFMSLSKAGELRRESACAELPALVTQSSEPVRMTKCVQGKKTQQWMHTKSGQLVHIASSKCLDRGTLQSMSDVFASQCDGGKTQAWHFDHYNVDT